MCSSTPPRSLLLNVQSGPIWNLSTYPSSGERTRRRLRWSIMYLSQTLLYDSQDSIYLAVHAPCSINFRQVTDSLWPTSKVRSGHIRPLHLQSVTDHEPHCRPVYSDKAWTQPTISAWCWRRHSLPAGERGDHSIWQMKWKSIHIQKYADIFKHIYSHQHLSVNISRPRHVPILFIFFLLYV